MREDRNIKLNYDAQYDVMYYSFGDTANSYGEDTSANVIVLKDLETDQITGYTIMNFKKICTMQDREYLELSHLIDLSLASAFIN